jgi:hypothetical protein
LTETHNTSQLPFKLLPNADLGILMAEVLAKGEPFQFTALGWSMAPFIKPGDQLVIEPIGKRKPSIGEIVALSLSESGSYRVHRIVRRMEQGFMVKGDNLLQADGIVTFEWILGRVKEVSRRGKKIRLGISIGRRWIALFSRWGLLSIIVGWLRKMKLLSAKISN